MDSTFSHSMNAIDQNYLKKYTENVQASKKKKLSWCIKQKYIGYSNSCRQKVRVLLQMVGCHLH